MANTTEKKALKVSTDGTVEVITYKPKDSLATFQKAVGGYIERLPFRGVLFDVLVNEEFLYTATETNSLATALWARQFPGDRQVIKGDVLITGLNMGNLNDKAEASARAILAGIDK